MDPEIQTIVSLLDLPDDAADALNDLVLAWCDPDHDDRPAAPARTPAWAGLIAPHVEQLRARLALHATFAHDVQDLLDTWMDDDWVDDGPVDEVSSLQSLLAGASRSAPDDTQRYEDLAELMDLPDDFVLALAGLVRRFRAYRRMPDQDESNHDWVPSLGAAADALIEEIARDQGLPLGGFRGAVADLADSWRGASHHSIDAPAPATPRYDEEDDDYDLLGDDPTTSVDQTLDRLMPGRAPVYLSGGRHSGSDQTIPPEDMAESVFDQGFPSAPWGSLPTMDESLPGLVTDRSVQPDLPPPLPPSLADQQVVVPDRGTDEVTQRFTEIGLLGIGGMGEVHRVHDRHMNRTVALKVIRPEMVDNERVLRRFLAEAQATGQLQHPGIVPVYEIGQRADGRTYFTMREVRGRDFGEIIKALTERRKVDPSASIWTVRRGVDLLLKVCEAMAYAHSRGVIHRDLKPDNIMVGNFGEVLTVDWGLSKVLSAAEPSQDEGRVMVDGDGLTMHGRVAGTPAYMPPEQASAESEAQGPWSDVYALGALLYEVLTGEQPFQGENAEFILKQVIMGRRRPWPEDRELPASLKRICDKAMSRKPEERYPTAKEMAKELAAWLEGSERQEKALGLLAQAREKYADSERLWARADAVRQAARHALDRSASVTTEMDYARVEQAEKLEQGAQTLDVVVTQLARAALAEYPDLQGARDLLADHYRRSHAGAESKGDKALADRFMLMLQAYDRGRHNSYMLGRGGLSLETKPPRADAAIYRFEEQHRRLELQPFQEGLPTPIDRLSLPMGSYMVVLRRDDHESVRYPVHIRRQEYWDGVAPEASKPTPVVMPPAGDLDDDEVFVPAGWCLIGDPQAIHGMPIQRVWLDDFVIKKFPVTNGEFLGFLNELVRDGRKADASRFAPATMGVGGGRGIRAYDVDRHGNYFIPPDLLMFALDRPVVHVMAEAAEAYCEWRSRLDGRSYRLPSELEWEKAARGVDGRIWPWGDRFDPAWCAMHESVDNPMRSTTYQDDIGPFGVQGMAGNVRDWCSDIYTARGPIIRAGQVKRVPRPRRARNIFRAVRGGSWLGSSDDCRCASRQGVPEDWRLPDVGFRLARPL